ncbi:hypothetical protein CN032_09055 [Salmonella enterica subsp. enterica serovar Newport]|nr:hypothetical protein [Salmonella enterica subsp. enterica serovar Newport]
MWQNIKIENVSKIEKTVAEFTVWMIGVLPYAKMKVKIFESNSGCYTGKTDLQIKRKFDGTPECAIGHGDTIEDSLENTIKYFNQMLKEDNLEKLTEDDIEYSEYSDF